MLQIPPQLTYSHSLKHQLQRAELPQGQILRSQHQQLHPRQPLLHAVGILCHDAVCKRFQLMPFGLLLGIRERPHDSFLTADPMQMFGEFLEGRLQLGAVSKLFEQISQG
uniref:(northern house mosquito) hypothetical protein n=1 Tax=Culex pipiens TaxID=7175 RepID=A0A8D8A2Q2_CULPI